MPDILHLSLFLGATIVLCITPGPAVLYIIARSIDQGRTAGLVSVLGIAVGSFVHIAAAALGISALLMTSAVAFNVVKYVGAAYLIYLGIRKLFSRDQLQTPELSKPKNLVSIFYDCCQRLESQNSNLLLSLLPPVYYYFKWFCCSPNCYFRCYFFTVSTGNRQFVCITCIKFEALDFEEPVCLENAALLYRWRLHSTWGSNSTFGLPQEVVHLSPGFYQINPFI